MKTPMILALIYVATVAAANLAVTHFGPSSSPFVAFVAIGFVMVARDRLHDAWSGNGLAWRMAALVAAGSALSVAINIDSVRIAIASGVAFAASETANALVYEPMRRRGVPWLQRSNIGNIPNALTDSAVFILLAFGPLWGLIALQTVAKLAGGALWTLVLAERRRRAVLPRNA